MSLELISAIATLTTAVVIGTTAVAAVIQLRHMRASNQIAGFLTLRNMLDDDAHQRAWALLYRGGDLSQDEGYCRYVADIASHKPTHDQSHYQETRAAVMMMANAIEVIGTLVRNRVVDERMFFEQYCGPIDELWHRLEGHVALERRAYNDDGIWEDFEYVAARSRQFARNQPSVYPAGVPHLLPPQVKKE